MRKIILLFQMIFFASCFDGDTNYYSFNNQEWFSHEIISFNINVDDSTKTYYKNISLRHTIDYKYQNLIIFVHQYLNNINIDTDTINMFLADDYGKWIGKGKKDIKEVTYEYEKQFFNRTGKYTFEIELAMRDKDLLEIEKLENVSDISFYLEALNE